jgi:hypothetical protein
MDICMNDLIDFRIRPTMTLAQTDYDHERREFANPVAPCGYALDNQQPTHATVASDLLPKWLALGVRWQAKRDTALDWLR